MRNDPVRTALIYAIRKADLSPPLGYPGGPCQVIERIQKNVRGPRERERLTQFVEEGEKFSLKDSAIIYDRDAEGPVKGSPFKQVLLSSHSQYRMDLRGITVQDIKLALRNFHDLYQKNPQRWERDIQTGRDFYWQDPKSGLSLVLVIGSYLGSKAAQIISAWWGSNEGKGVPMSRDECKVFTGWAGQKPSAQRVASRYMDAGIQDMWLQWIVQPLSVIWKHHKEFVQGPVDDVMDAIIKDLAPHLVKEIVEREVDKDLSEFQEGALKGNFDTNRGYLADVDSTKTEDWREGYEWGFNHSVPKPNFLPSSLERRLIEEGINEVRHQITEKVVEDALQKAWHAVSPATTVRAIITAVKKHGWKLGLGFALFELTEHFMIPSAVSYLTGDPKFMAMASLPISEVVYAVAFRILGRAPKSIDKPTEVGWLDWYEEHYGPVRIASLRR